MDTQAARRPGEVVFCVLMLLASIFLLWNAYKISGFSGLSSPGAFPLAATSVMVIAALFALVRTISTPAGATGWSAIRRQVLPTVLVAFAALIVAYGLLLESLGFIITSLAFLFAGIWLLHRRGPLVAFGWAVLSIALVYVIFRLVFQVVLPEGIVPERRILAILADLLAQWGR